MPLKVNFKFLIFFYCLPKNPFFVNCIFQPKFIDAAKLWEQLRNQLYILSEINIVNEQLMALTFSAPEWATITDAIIRLTTMTTGTTLLTTTTTTPKRMVLALAEVNLESDAAVDVNTAADNNCQHTNDVNRRPLNAFDQKTVMVSPPSIDVELMKIVKYQNGMKVSENI